MNNLLTELEHEERRLIKLMGQIRPRHAKKFKQFSRPWFRACDRAFMEAMHASGEYARDTEKPSFSLQTA